MESFLPEGEHPVELITEDDDRANLQVSDHRRLQTRSWLSVLRARFPVHAAQTRYRLFGESEE
jgi:hypothetical protein